MNPSQQLIMLFNKTDMKWEDATEKIVFLKQTKYYGNLAGYKVTFTNGKTYPYNLQSIQVYENPIIINTSNKDIIVDGYIYFECNQILKFDHFFKVFLNSGNTILSTSLEMVKNKRVLKTDVFKYYKDVAYHAVKQSNNIDSVETFIYDQYKKIQHVHVDSAFYAFVSGHSKKLNSAPFVPLFPFEFNQSQKHALLEAFSNQVSIIEGPPGCGKTQVILNILMNLVYQNKKVLVVSNNNTAIKNINDKLEEENLDFLCALLGNNDNKNNFFLEETYLKRIEKYRNSFSTYEARINKHYNLKTNGYILDSLHSKEQYLSKLRTYWMDLKKEYEHFCVSFSDIIKSYDMPLKLKTSNQYLKSKIYIESTKKWHFIRKLRLKWQYKIKREAFDNINDLIVMLEHGYYVCKIKEVNREILSLESYFKKHNMESIKSEYIAKSRDMLFEKIKSKYLDKPIEAFTMADYKIKFPAFIRKYPIILSTSHAILSSINQNMLFDYLIVDEASQSDLLSSVLAMSAAKNIIVVGDSKQLQQIDNEKIKDFSNEIASRYKIPSVYRYHNHALLGAFKEIFKDTPCTLLKEHYRCHPSIIHFINQRFYDNELIIMTQSNNNEPIELIELVKGNHARKNPNGSGFYNQREIDEVKAYLNSHTISNLGIITPFRYQANQYRLSLDNQEIELDTVHKFQGRQKDSIILSTVLNGNEKTEENERLYDFINNPKLFNVALSRAKNKIIMIGTEGFYNSKNNHFSDFIAYAKYRVDQTKLTKATVTSVFDILYETSSKLYQNKKHIVITEKLILELILDVLNAYKSIKVSMHVSVNKIIANLSQFNDIEKNYLSHHLTHVDFIIYNNITKKNLLAIEVDGIKFHEQNEKQYLRDKIKDKAFHLADIPLLRLKTNGSSERQHILDNLNKVLSL